MTWQTKKLGEALSVITNGVNCKQDKSGQGDQITRIETIAQAQIDFNRVGYCKLNKTEKLKYKLKRGDILFSHINSVIHVGKTAIFNSDEELYHGINLLLMRPEKFILPDYLQYFLKSLFLGGYWNTVCKQSINQASVNQQDIKKVEILYPNSISEQKRIVKKLDGVFEKVTKAKENAEKNLQNSKELFESYLQSVFANPGKDWTIQSLENACDFQNGFAFKSKLFTQTGDPILRISNIQNGGISYKRLVFFQKKSYRENLDKYRAKSGDLIIAMSGATTGKLAICDAKETFYLNQRVGKFIPKDNLSKMYLYYFLSTKIKENLKISAGSAQPNLSTEQIKSIQIPFPKIKEQNTIVKKLNELSIETKKLEKIYEQKLADLEELKKSILSKAFHAEL